MSPAWGIRWIFVSGTNVWLTGIVFVVVVDDDVSFLVSPFVVEEVVVTTSTSSRCPNHSPPLSLVEKDKKNIS